MNQVDEDALPKIMYTWPTQWLEAAMKAGFATPKGGGQWEFINDTERDALAVFAGEIYEAAVAQERERAAKCADFHIKMANKHGWIIDSAIPAIAAAIRRGEE